MILFHRAVSFIQPKVMSGAAMLSSYGREATLPNEFWSDALSRNSQFVTFPQLTPPLMRWALATVTRARVIFPRHWNRTPLISFGRTGVIETCTFHSCPEIRGCTGMYCTAS